MDAEITLRAYPKKDPFNSMLDPGIETHKQWRGCHRKAGSRLSYDEYENAIAEAVNQLNSPTTAKVGSLVATASTTRKRLFPQCLSQIQSRVCKMMSDT